MPLICSLSEISFNLKSGTISGLPKTTGTYTVNWMISFTFKKTQQSYDTDVIVKCAFLDKFWTSNPGL